jgi:hypothetical protein
MFKVHKFPKSQKNNNISGGENRDSGTRSAWNPQEGPAHKENPIGVLVLFWARLKLLEGKGGEDKEYF